MNPRGVKSTNGLNSDGSLMNVGNKIWDPEEGGRPSIRLFPEYSSGAQMIEALAAIDPDDSEASAPQHPKTDGVKQVLEAKEPKSELVVPTQTAQRVTSDRDLYSGSAIANLLGGGSRGASDETDIEASGQKSSKAAALNEDAPKPAKPATQAPDEFVQAGLYRAVQEGNMKLIKIALEIDGANINGTNQDDDHWTALHYASHKGVLRIVNYLLQFEGIDRSIKDANGKTAADVAKSKDISDLLTQ